MSERPDVVEPLPDDEQFPDQPEDGSDEEMPESEDEDFPEEEEDV